MPPVAGSSKEKRSRKGCMTCRARRIKCDQTHPTCGECERKGFRCDYGSGSASGGTVFRVTRPRRAESCAACRARKVRCSASTDDAKCARCKRLSIPCEWTNQPITSDGPSVVSPQTTIPPSELSPTQSLVLDNGLWKADEVHRLAQLYFQTVHQYSYMSFIHPPSFYRLLDKGKAPRELAMLMIACALRLNPDTTSTSLARADEIFNDVRPSLWSTIYSGYGAIHLMTVILSQLYEHARGNFSSAWMLSGCAVRMMQFLFLHILDESYPQHRTVRLNPLLKPEALRRLAWSVFFMDSNNDGGKHSFGLVSDSYFRIQLPCDETAFVRGETVATATIDQMGLSMPSVEMSVEGPNHVGIGAHIIRTVAARRRILHYSNNFKYSTEPVEVLAAGYSAMENDLNAIIVDLPPSLAYNEDNLFIHADRRTAFIQLHVLRHGCYNALNRGKLLLSQKMKQPVEAGDPHRMERIRHAMPISRILQDALRLQISCGPDVGILAYTSLEILLFEPPRLVSHDPSIDPKSSRYRRALEPLLAFVRQQSKFYSSMRNLLVEACHRLIHCGFKDMLTSEDWEACRSDFSNLAGMDDAEFDFRLFRFHRYENALRRNINLNAPLAAEALLDLGTNTGNTSPYSSPEPVDAGEMMTGVTPLPTSTSAAPPNMDLFEQTSPMRDWTSFFDPTALMMMGVSPQQTWNHLDYQAPQNVMAGQHQPVADDFFQFLEQSGRGDAQIDTQDWWPNWV